MSAESKERPKSEHSSSGPSGYRPSSTGRPGGPGGGSFNKPYGQAGGFRKKPPFRRRVCKVCLEKGGVVDWKAVNFLRVFLTDRGKIIGARSRGTCSSCQREVGKAIRRARTMALLPFASY